MVLTAMTLMIMMMMMVSMMSLLLMILVMLMLTVMLLLLLMMDGAAAAAAHHDDDDDDDDHGSGDDNQDDRDKQPVHSVSLPEALRCWHQRSRGVSTRCVQPFQLFERPVVKATSMSTNRVQGCKA